MGARAVSRATPCAERLQLWQGTGSQDAEAAGCVAISGLEMFLGQAAEQYRLFTQGREPPPAAAMRQFIVDHIASL